MARLAQPIVARVPCHTGIAQIAIFAVLSAEVPETAVRNSSEDRLFSGKKKAHKHKLFCPVGLGTTPGMSRGFHWVRTWDKSGENLGQTRVFSLLYTVEARFHRVCPWDKPSLSQGQSRGRRAAQKV